MRVPVSDVLVSAGTLAELLIVAGRRGVAHEAGRLMRQLHFEVAPVTEATARAIGEHYRRWGKGFDLAGLNFGDCFAYGLARERGCRLLFTGDDFSRTDIDSLLAHP